MRASANNLEVWYWERRAGQMANIQLPIIVALAGKNNVISWLTGISHEKVMRSSRAYGPR
jgi:ferric-chelate reductase